MYKAKCNCKNIPVCADFPSDLSAGRIQVSVGKRVNGNGNCRRGNASAKGNLPSSKELLNNTRRAMLLQRLGQFLGDGHGRCRLGALNPRLDRIHGQRRDPEGQAAAFDAHQA